MENSAHTSLQNEAATHSTTNPRKQINWMDSIPASPLCKVCERPQTCFDQLGDFQVPRIDARRLTGGPLAMYLQCRGLEWEIIFRWRCSRNDACNPPYIHGKQCIYGCKHHESTKILVIKKLRARVSGYRPRTVKTMLDTESQSDTLCGTITRKKVNEASPTDALQHHYQTDWTYRV